MKPFTSCLVAVAVLGCQGPELATVSFGSGTGSGIPASSTGQSSSTSSGTSGVTGLGPEVSSSTNPTGTGTTALMLDVGGADLGSLHPTGCAGKIDFLFVISRSWLMESMQERLIDAFPKFIATIESRFAGFDYHIMVVDGDDFWGSTMCNSDCSPNNCPYTDYPCAAMNQVSACDTTMGAGTVFPAGDMASNEVCEIAGGRRYLTSEQPNLEEAFACIAQIGASGGDSLADALTAALSPELNGPGGCNEGFLRDDALLMATFIYNTPDDSSEGTRKEWAESILQAKHGDPNAVVLFGLSQPGCPSPWDRICDLVSYYFPYWYVGSNEDEDFGPAFEIATDRVIKACSEFIPK